MHPNSNITDTDWKRLPQLTGLVELDLTGGCSDFILNILTNLTGSVDSLESCTMAVEGLNGNHMAVLAQFERLRKLEMVWVENGDAIDWQPIQRLTKVKELRISVNRTGQSINNILNHFGSPSILKKLRITGWNSALSAEIIQF